MAHFPHHRAAGDLLAPAHAPRAEPRPRGRSDVFGIAEIRFVRRDGATRLAHLYQRDPLRVLLPQPDAGEIPLGVLLTTSGGLVAGDSLKIDVDVEPGAAAHLTAAAAEKVYRSTGATTAITQELRAGEAAWLEYLPPETILFDGASLRRSTRIDLAPRSGFLGGGILVFGRQAYGERLTHGLVNERWEVWRERVLVWGDALHLDGDIAANLADPACFAGATACATLILMPPTADPGAFLDDARAVQARSAGSALQAGATVVNGLLIARWLASDALSLRRAYADLACHLREAAMGLPPRLPRLWHV